VQGANKSIPIAPRALCLLILVSALEIINETESILNSRSCEIEVLALSLSLSLSRDPRTIRGFEENETEKRPTRDDSCGISRSGFGVFAHTGQTFYFAIRVDSPPWNRAIARTSACFSYAICRIAATRRESDRVRPFPLVLRRSPPCELPVAARRGRTGSEIEAKPRLRGALRERARVFAPV